MADGRVPDGTTLSSQATEPVCAVSALTGFDPSRLRPIDPAPDFIIRAQQWLHSHDVGLSSKAIFHYMTLGIKAGWTPSDTSDLGRCIRLLERFPEWKCRMPEMASVSGDWAALTGIWDELVGLYASDIDAASEMLSSLWYDKSGPYWTRIDRDSDGSPSGRDRETGLDGEAATARVRQDIAQKEV